MTFHPMLMFAWAALAIIFFGLLMYRGQLTRYEDEQLFLNDKVKQNEQELQTKIVRRVTRIEPFVRAFGGAAGLITALVVGMYVYNAWLTIR